MKIYQTITKVPGGLMVVPLFLGMIINTFCPNLLKIGGFTEALSGAGYPTVLGMYLFTVGTKMTFNAAPRMLKRGFGILFAKVAVAMLISLSVAKFFGGELFGLSTLALLVAMSDTNGGMFMALTSAMGNKEDAGTYVAQSIETGPFLTMVILVGAGLANIPWLSMVSVVAPIFAGAILGNLDGDLREFFGSKEGLVVPFMAFTLGQNINLNNVVAGGLSGIFLGLLVFVVTGICCVFADKMLGGSGVAGAAASSTAGNAAAVPKAIAAADPSYAAIAPVATVQVAASVIVTAVLTPLLTAYVYRKVQKRNAQRLAEGMVATDETAPPPLVTDRPAYEQGKP
ncbi:2-keto-3-deoxygluconate permease [Ancylobacter mangrovi]|uniref:2-keto-3-deoxygluconate permease n=1 Tax=Ancylobacter mangrovi TaxID=2972472 RepID=UPI0021639858|nr:2-keto-3-deoxygluconate permease [Ancylobacter mangrovi]MCS0503230.1 2-keto-3-deoxygluconate permease [Ancylobacter mangrovi]